MEELNELIRQYGLDEDIEHIIIPLPEIGGKKRRCFLLKRRYIRLAYPDGIFLDYPIAEVVEAIIKYPELLLSKALYLLLEEKGIDIPEIYEQRKRTEEK
ncbi:MAG: hypothetical protein A2X59_03855 [Nitrospirae bacterium GWC2_42_7]|nr:MAG: hypothetical protein A2X59_03855 [Nitrospirae bacterium GWC2_42_7]